MTKLSILVSSLLLASSASATLWPIPAHYEQGDKPIWLSPDVKLEFGGSKGSGNYGSTTSGSKKVLDAWGRTKDALFKTNIVPWQFHPKGTQFEPTPNSGTTIKKVIISQTGKDVDAPTYENLKEAYNLTIPASSDTVYIDAETSLGVMHGLTTLQQLFYASQSKKAGGAVWGKGPVTIVDEPKFKHRGLNLDVSRQWYPKETIMKVIDTLAFNKMNRLHLHATDSQSWPLEIPAMPELSQKGAYRPDLTYTPADLQQILDFAEARGIQVIVEIDMPGHTTSIADSHPDLIVGRNIQPNWDTYAAQPPSGSLKLNNKNVESFLSKLFRDLLPRLNKHTKYFHTGGDEINANVYALDPGVGSNDKTKIQPYLQKFSNHVQSELARQKMSPFVWEEMLNDWNITLPKETIVQVWQTDEAAQKATEKGFRVIQGNYNFWYLDCGQGQWLDFGGPAFKKFYPFADYCSPRKNWRLIYSYSPTQFLTEAQAKLVLGGEVHIWSEQIDSQSIDMMLWPRGSAAAEVLWSGRTDANGNNRTFADATPRLAEMRERMVARGVRATPVTQLWCLSHPHACELNT